MCGVGWTRGKEEGERGAVTEMSDCCASVERSVAGREADAARDFAPWGGKWADEGFEGAAVEEGGTGVLFLAFSMASRTSSTNCRRT